MRPSSRVLLLLATLVVAATAPGPTLNAQTLRGTLRAWETDQPIALGQVFLLGEAGDTVASALSGPGGAFLLRASRTGSFYLRASALGYRETTVGVFDLGDDGDIAVEFRIRPQAVAVDGITVDVSHLIREPFLISNGFYQRMQSGLGRFITPGEIEKSNALRATDLLHGIPRVDLVIEEGRPRVTMNSPMGPCAPNIYVDGILMSTDGREMDAIAPLFAVEAIEVFRGAAELPLQWSGTGAGGCGAIVVWTKR